MTATQLALGIFFGLTSVEIFKVVIATLYENHKRNAMHRQMSEVADSFIEKMHNEVMAERAANEAKTARRRKPATKKAPVKKPVAKKKVTAKKGK